MCRRGQFIASLSISAYVLHHPAQPFLSFSSTASSLLWRFLHRLFGCVTVHCFHADAAVCLSASICTILQLNCAVERPEPRLGPWGSSCQRVEQLLSRKRLASDQHSLHSSATPLSHCIFFPFEYLNVFFFPDLFSMSFFQCFSCQRPWTGPGRLKRIGKAMFNVCFRRKDPWNMNIVRMLAVNFGLRYCLAFGFVEV